MFLMNVSLFENIEEEILRHSIKWSKVVPWGYDLPLAQHTSNCFHTHLFSRTVEAKLKTRQLQTSSLNSLPFYNPIQNLNSMQNIMNQSKSRNQSFRRNNKQFNSFKCCILNVFPFNLKTYLTTEMTLVRRLWRGFVHVEFLMDKHDAPMIWRRRNFKFDIVNKNKQKGMLNVHLCRVTSIGSSWIIYPLGITQIQW